MPLRISESEDEPSLNLTPMIDIVFLLIIFFMVGTQFTALERQYDVELPTVAEAPPLTNLPDELIVNIQGSGVIQLRGEAVTLEKLEQELITARQNYPDQAVMLRGEGTGPYQHIMNVLAVCHRAKINNISLANRLKRGDE